jgi:hypothetical protein
MSSLLQNLIDQHPEAFDRLFFIVRLGLFVYIAIGLFPILRKHVLNWSNSNTNAPQSANAPTVYNTQQAAQYLHTAQPTADNTQPAALYTHPAQPAANAPQSLNTPRPLNAPNAYNTQQAAHYTSQTQPTPLRIPSPEQFVAKLIRLYRASIIYVRIGHSDLRIACIPALLILAFLFLFR